MFRRETSDDLEFLPIKFFKCNALNTVVLKFFVVFGLLPVLFFTL